MELNNANIKTSLGKNIRKFRFSLNLTQDELSEKANISTQFLKQIEAGRMIGSVTTLVKLCIALDTTPNNILYELFEDEQKTEENLIFKISKLSKRDKKLIRNLVDNMLQ